MFIRFVANAIECLGAGARSSARKKCTRNGGEVTRADCEIRRIVWRPGEEELYAFDKVSIRCGFDVWISSVEGTFSVSGFAGAGAGGVGVVVAVMVFWIWDDGR